MRETVRVGGEIRLNIAEEKKHKDGANNAQRKFYGTNFLHRPEQGKFIRPGFRCHEAQPVSDKKLLL